MTKRTHEEIDALLGRLGEHGGGDLNPDAGQLRALVAADLGGPLQFVNLLAYHDLARYPVGHELAGSGLTGAQAYGRYGIVAIDHVTRRGGRLTMVNEVEQVLIGTASSWNQVAVMEYPDTDAFVDMICDPGYLAGLVHRDAGLAATMVLVTRPLLPPPGS